MRLKSLIYNLKKNAYNKEMVSTCVIKITFHKVHYFSDKNFEFKTLQMMTKSCGEPMDKNYVSSECYWL